MLFFQDKVIEHATSLMNRRTDSIQFHNQIQAQSAELSQCIIQKKRLQIIKQQEDIDWTAFFLAAKAEQESVRDQSTQEYQYLVWKADWWDRKVKISDLKIADYEDSQQEDCLSSKYSL